MKKETIKAREKFEIEHIRQGRFRFALKRKGSRKVLGRFESHMGAYNARARHFKAMKKAA